MSAKVKINGVTYDMQPNDVLFVIGKDIRVNESIIGQLDPASKITVEITGDLMNVDTNQNITMHGNVAGYVDSGGDFVLQGKVDGNVAGGGNVSVTGNVFGNVKAGGNVQCVEIGGSVEAGGNIIRRLQ